MMKFCSVLFAIFVTSCCSVKPTNQFSNLTESVARVVILRNDMEVSSGSSVLVNCVSQDVGYKLYLLTAKHVVAHHNDLGIKVVIELGNLTFEVSQIIDNPHGLDLSVLVVTSKTFYNPAQLLPGAPEAYSAVYSAGFPLGIGLVVTDGYINCPAFNDLWLCSASIIFGNSGGGVFDRATNKLAGISVQVLSMDAQSPVAHLHLFIPTNLFSNWLIETYK